MINYKKLIVDEIDEIDRQKVKIEYMPFKSVGPAMCCTINEQKYIFINTKDFKHSEIEWLWILGHELMHHRYKIYNQGLKASQIALNEEFVNEQLKLFMQGGL